MGGGPIKRVGGGRGWGRRRGGENSENLNGAGWNQRTAKDSAPGRGRRRASLRQSVAPAWEVASGIHVNQGRGANGRVEGAGPRRVPLRAGAAKRAGERAGEQGGGALS